MKTVILCGGRGTRAYPHTVEVPKPLLEVGDRPVLQHVMEVYASQGFTSFVLAAGYKADHIEAYAEQCPADWDVTVRDTGLDTPTGERIRRCADLLGDTFFATYGDGVADVDLVALLDFHRGHDGDATLTTVPLPSPYGTVHVDEGGRVDRFEEKPRLPDHPINAGFLAFDAAVFDHWQGTDLEQEVLPALAQTGRLHARQHLGFWRSMDTYKDSVELTRLIETSAGHPPWLRAASEAPLAGGPTP